MKEENSQAAMDKIAEGSIAGNDLIFCDRSSWHEVCNCYLMLRQNGRQVRAHQFGFIDLRNCGSEIEANKKILSLVNGRFPNVNRVRYGLSKEL